MTSTQLDLRRLKMMSGFGMTGGVPYFPDLESAGATLFNASTTASLSDFVDGNRDVIIHEIRIFHTVAMLLELFDGNGVKVGELRCAASRDAQIYTPFHLDLGFHVTPDSAGTFHVIYESIPAQGV